MPTDRTAESVKQPTFSIVSPPEELWMIADLVDGHFIFAIDCKGEPLLAYTSWDDAVQGCDSHKDWYDIDCEPVRVK